MAQLLSVPLGSMHRMLLDLEGEGVVERTEGGEWELSLRLLAIVGQQLDRIEIPRLARPLAERMATATGETVNLYVVSGTQAVCMDKVQGGEGMQLDMRIGHRGAMTCGGAGKAILAWLDAPMRERVLAEPIVALTPSTITDRAMLEAELSRIRGRGYSIDDQEVVTGVWCVSVPMLDRQGRAVGAISISGPSVKAPGPGVAPLVGMLNEACGHGPVRAAGQEGGCARPG
jgi:IclR family acetate operon transcriptional repressor